MNPTPIRLEKREGAALLPYRKTGEEYVYYVQKRDPNAVRSPGMIGYWGGGIEPGESITQALMREIDEELGYAPQKPIYFSRYENAHAIFHMFIEEVGDDFENQVVIGEGEYGLFLTKDAALSHPLTTPHLKLIISQVAEYLAK